MKFAIRVDAAPELGSGHVVRMLTLANALHVREHNVCFLARRLSQHLADAVRSRDHEVVMLPLSSWRAPAGAPWDVDEQEHDVAECKRFISRADWVICDHYGLDAVWERAVRLAGRRIMAVDDLGRTHICDLLLDQNYYADPSRRYADGVVGELLLGPKFALLGPEFARLHELARPREGAVRRMFLCMGGADARDATSVALDTIEAAELADIALDVVIGAGHPAQAAIAARCAASSFWRLHIQTREIAALMAAADLAIGAGGTATWERCAVGLPTLAVELADNQHAILTEGARAGFLCAAGSTLESERLSIHLRAFAENTDLRRRMSQIALRVTDGRGAGRVTQRLEQS